MREEIPVALPTARPTPPPTRKSNGEGDRSRLLFEDTGVSSTDCVLEFDGTREKCTIEGLEVNTKRQNTEIRKRTKDGKFRKPEKEKEKKSAHFIVRCERLFCKTFHSHQRKSPGVDLHRKLLSLHRVLVLRDTVEGGVYE